MRAPGINRLRPGTAAGRPRPPSTAAAGTRPGARPRRAGRALRQLAVAAPFVLPSLAGVLLFLVLPVVLVLALSFARWNFLAPATWVGWENFGRITRDYHLLRVLETSAFYVLWNIPLQTVFALGLALLLNRRLPGMGLFRALYVLPYMSMPVAMAVIWGWMFNARNGAVNHLLALVGIHGPDWLGDVHTALPVVAMVSTWQYAGYNMLFFLAGLQAIPPHLYEAASIDGAGPVQRFFRITLPLLNPTMLFVLVTDVIGSFQVFDVVYVLTQGGPGTATDVVNYQIYSTAFRNFDVGSAAAMSLVLFVVILTATVAQFRFFRNRTTYDIG